MTNRSPVINSINLINSINYIYALPATCCPSISNPKSQIKNPKSKDPQQFYLARTIFGSSVSLSPSPSKLIPSTAQAMAKPGKIAIQGARDI